MIMHNLPHYFWIFLNSVDRSIAAVLIWSIIQIRPLLGPPGICPFVIGCTEFAIIALETRSTPLATLIITKRLLMCNPVWLWLHTPKRNNLNP